MLSFQHYYTCNIVDEALNSVELKHVIDYVNQKKQLEPLLLENTPLSIVKLMNAVVESQVDNQVNVKGDVNFLNITFPAHALYMKNKSGHLLFAIKFNLDGQFQLSKLFPQVGSNFDLQLPLSNVEVHVTNAVSTKNMTYPGVNILATLSLKQYEPFKMLSENLNINIDKLIVCGSLGFRGLEMSTMETFQFSGQITGDDRPLICISDTLSVKNASLIVYLSKSYFKQKWECEVELQTMLTIKVNDKSSLECDTRLRFLKDRIGASAELSEWKGAFGYEKLTLKDLHLSINIFKEKSFNATVSTHLTICDKTDIAFRGTIGKGGNSIIASVENFTVNDLISLYNAVFGEKVSCIEHDVTFENVRIGYSSVDTELDGIAFKKGFTVQCKFKIPQFHELAVDSEFNMNSSGIQAVVKLDKINLGDIVIEKANLSIAFYKESEKKATTFELGGTVKFKQLGLELSVKVLIERDPNTKQNSYIVYTDNKVDIKKLSDLIPALKDTFVDEFTFGRIIVAYSSNNSRALLPSLPCNVQKGLQVIVELGGDSSDLNNNVNMTSLNVLTGGSTSGKKMVLICCLKKDEFDLTLQIPGAVIHLGDNIECDPLMIDLKLGRVPTFRVRFGLTLKLDDPLHFVASLDVSPISAGGAFNMEGWWREPFGVKNVSIGDKLGISIAINYAQFAATGLPSSFGLAAGLQVGEIKGDVAMELGSNNLLLIANINKLNSSDLLEMIGLVLDIEIDTRDIPKIFEVRDFSLYLAPNGGRIGVFEYDAGMSMKGYFYILGLQAYVECRFSTEKSPTFMLKGIMKATTIGPLKIRAKHTEEAYKYLQDEQAKKFISDINELGPIVDLQIDTSNSKVYLNGSIEFLGATLDVEISLGAYLISTSFEFDLWGLFTATFEFEAMSNPSNLKDTHFYVKATVVNKLQEYIIQAIKDAFNHAIEAVKDGEEKALKYLEEKKQEYSDEAALEKASRDESVKKSMQALDVAQQNANKERDSARKSFDKAKENLQKAEIQWQQVFLDQEKQMADFLKLYNSEVDASIELVVSAKEKYYAALDTAQRILSENEVLFNEAMSQAEQHQNQLFDKVENERRVMDKIQADLDDTQKLYAVEQDDLYLDMIDQLKVNLEIAQKSYDLFTREYQEAKQLLERTKTGPYYQQLQTSKQELQSTKTDSKEQREWEEMKNQLREIVKRGEAKMEEIRQKWKNLREKNGGLFEKAKENLKDQEFTMMNIDSNCDKLIAIARKSAVISDNWANYNWYKTVNGVKRFFCEIAEVAVKVAGAISDVALSAMRDIVTGILSLFAITYINLEGEYGNNSFKMNLEMRGWIMSQNNPWEFNFELDLRDITSMIKEFFSMLLKMVIG